MNRRLFLATGIAIMAMSPSFAEDKPKLPVTAELTGETKYVLDLGGQTAEEFEKSLKPEKNKFPMLPKPPKVDLMSSASFPLGSPPAFGPMIVQKNEWLACPPPLLRTAVRISSGTAFRLLIKSSIDFEARSGLSLSALLTLVM